MVAAGDGLPGGGGGGHRKQNRRKAEKGSAVRETF